MTSRMTIRQIAETAGCKRETVRLTIKRLLPDLKTKSGVTIKLLQEDAMKVMEALPKRSMVSSLPENGQVHLPENVQVQTQQATAELVISIVTPMMEMMMSGFKEMIKEIRQPAQTVGPPEQLQLPSVPPKSNRAALNQIVRQYADRTGCAHSSAWNSLFSEMLYRGRVNLTVKAKKRGMARMDYAQEHGYLPTLLAIAIEIYSD